MRYAPITERLQGLGGAKWEVHAMAKAMMQTGQEVIPLTIGEPDVPPPEELFDKANAAMRAGRYGYSNGRGEPGLLAALAARYTKRTGRTIGPNQIMCFPGTQTSLYAVLTGLVGPGDEVLVGDPMYATYEAVIRAPGASVVPVPLRPENGFRMAAEDVAARITPASRVLFLNTPHNPTGAVLTREDLMALGRLAREHNLWILSDEVYEELIFGGEFLSPLDIPDFAERTIVVSSISKSHAAPGFRSGWAVGPGEFMARLLPVAETMLFGNQPFIADMTALAVSRPSPVAPGMVERFSRRARLLKEALHGVNAVHVHEPQAGMFSVVDIRATGLSGEDFARKLLLEERVAVMPGESFGPSLNGWLRISLTRSDAEITEACRRIAAFIARRMEA
ncbi:pyridoxal phosphate-dependent aminotransferase [Stagnihabitans tardus]|uniref:aspartate transaminase n=1 Tax=Stagnihabitans tardus TaxID=2699202 RepID=A0AAE5BVK5_9RHOB|nr:pyridoxal phosphate-dependent aminotransferase [Stagnihabitans tardus]NBZ88342.1 aminotransferase class I/II-fold pyridoxal phosphate-dependent enzyme [Stagnihabitans tardus]